MATVEFHSGFLNKITKLAETRLQMKTTMTKLRRTIRRVIKESSLPHGTILDLASRPGGVHIDELVEMFGKEIFKKIDELEASGLLYMEDDGTVKSLRGY